MPLEATMFCLDNSEWMRNGDYSPTRLRSQNDAVQALATSYLRDNIESTTGFLTMAGGKVDVHLSPCKNMGKMLKLLNELKPNGVCDIITSLKIAQLTLKNRQNKNQRQRIILFIGSPIQATADEFTGVGKMLKKNNVAVDVVLFGTETANADNTEKVEALIAAVNNDNNSHLVTIPPTPGRLMEFLSSSPLAIGGGSGGSRNPSSIGVDTAATFDELDSLMEVDPELAMALRMSLEDSGMAPPPAQTTTATTETPVKTTTTTDTAMVDDGMDDDDDDAALAAAIALSLEMEAQEEAAKDTSKTTTSSEDKMNDSTTATTNNTDKKAEDAAQTTTDTAQDDEEDDQTSLAKLLAEVNEDLDQEDIDALLKQLNEGENDDDASK